MTWPAIVVWILIFAGLLRRSPLYLVYLFFGLGAFMSLTVLPAEGSVTLVPQSACAIFLVGKMLLAKGQLSRAFDAAIDPARLGLLFAFLIYALFSAFLMPRLFANMVETVAMNSQVAWGTLLQPSSSNIAQSGYMTASVGVAFVFALYSENASFRHHYLQALWGGCLILIATGLIDMTFAAAGLGSLLEPFRNAYSLLVDVEVLGSKRVVGLMPEASVYGSTCVGAMANLVFLRPCYATVLMRDRLVPLTILGLLTMAVLSTSSSAYVGLAVFGLVFAANWLRRAFSPDVPGREALNLEAMIALSAALAVLAVIVLMPHLMDPIYAMIDEMVFKKTESASYEERTMWTRVALQAFFATDGIGVGIGSVRTSNWFVSILASTGFIGAGLLAWFILRLYFLPCRAADPRTREMATALKFGLLPQFAMLALIGTTPDIGVGTAAAMGVLTSLTSIDPATKFRFRGKVGGRLQARSHPR
jgi:hypothetical protein